MGLGQTLLTIMALMLMGRLIISINTATLESGFTKDMAEYRITGTSLGTSMLEESSALPFDENTIDTTITSVAVTSLSPTLGPENPHETSVDLFDDIDDYNNYVKYDTLENSAIFKTEVIVRYVEADNITKQVNVSASQTFNKEVIVEITSNFLVDYSVDPARPDTLRFKQVFSYWRFR